MFGLTWPGIFDAAQQHPVWGGLAGFLIQLGLFSQLVLFFVFPNGRFVPRWTRWVAAFALLTLYILFPDSPRVQPPEPINIWAFVGLWAICLYAQVYRYRRVSGPVERQQAKWLVFGVGVLVASLVAFFLPLVVFLSLDQPGVPSLIYDLVGRTIVGWLGFLLIPLSIGVAILRYRLYDIDVIINRTLVYGSLTVMLGLVYFGSVASLQYAFRALTAQEEQPQLTIVVSTLVIAALFSPLRRRIQSFIDRRFYSEKYDARKTLVAFSAKLRDETDLDALKNELVGVVTGTMQPAHASLWLRSDTGPMSGDEKH
jgi:hypothetical protein